MHPRRSFIAASAFILCGLTACNTPLQDPGSAAPGNRNGDPGIDPDRYHEKSFSWDAKANSPAGNSALAKVSAKQTRFDNPEELAAAIQRLESELEDREFTDSLWKPVDYACDELDLALWNAFGTVVLQDSVVFSEEILKSRCRLSDDIGENRGEGLGTPAEGALSKGAGLWWSSTETSDRQYPYKMIGRSWDDFNLSVYKSTGGETQFEKYRAKLGVSAWYDTDATRIGVRIYLFDCGRDRTGALCSYNRSKTNWFSNDDYASEREIATGSVRISKTGISIDPVTLKIADAVYSMHSVDHAGLQFRANSSSGLSPETRIDALISPTYVTW